MKMQTENVLKYHVLFEEAEEGGYTATVPLLTGCISEGDTFEETKKNIAEAIVAYLESLAMDGEKIPEGNRSVFMGQVAVPKPTITP